MITPGEIKAGITLIDAIRQALGWSTSKRKKWDIFLRAAATIIEKENRIMATLAELKSLSEQQVARIDVLNTALDGFREVMEGIKAELEALKARDLTPEQQAQVDSIAETMNTGLAKIEETLAENTPADPVEPPPEV